MTHISKSALLPYSAEQIYKLVNDIESYPQFMDGCVGAIIIEQSDVHMIARLDLSKAGIKQSFTTRNSLRPFEEIVLALEEGPFSSLTGSWRFQPLNDEACKVLFDLTFEVNQKLVQKAVEKLFNSVANGLVNSLDERARFIYGKKI